MSVYLIEGKLGSGKSLSVVSRIRERLVAGVPVVTNINLKLEVLVGPKSKKVRVIRIPDKPSVEHLHAIGIGNESYDERRNGMIVLDELATWLNARTFADPKRQAVIDWLVHSRKRGWDVYFLCQNINQIDKQVREALVEYRVTCRRLDRIGVPVVGPLVKLLTFGLVKLHLPQVHMASVRYGAEANAIIADRWVYRGKDLYKAYDTRQVFVDDPEQAPFSYLPPAYTHGWKRVQRRFSVKGRLEETRRLWKLHEAGLVSYDEWRGMVKRI
ncbi:zonular occludens toxin domain-containing protein [Ralstonia sp.]|uniref:zonular occludens toxin domain-containing protein n=1 Tax=Ralstonia sp. TaxID=54061 RepID=UPI0031CF4C72